MTHEMRWNGNVLVCGMRLPCKHSKWNKWHRPRWLSNWLHGRFYGVSFLVRYDAMEWVMAFDALYPYWWLCYLDLWQKCRPVEMPFLLRHRWVLSIAKISPFASMNCASHSDFVKMKRLCWPMRCNKLFILQYSGRLSLITYVPIRASPVYRATFHIQHLRNNTYQWNSRRSYWNRWLRTICVACVRVVRLFHFYV